VFELASCHVRRDPLRSDQESVDLVNYTPQLVCEGTDWIVYDEARRKNDRSWDNVGCWIDLYGRTADNFSVVLSVEFQPFLLVEFPHLGPQQRTPSGITLTMHLREAMAQNMVAEGKNPSSYIRRPLNIVKARERCEKMDIEAVQLHGKRQFGFHPDLRPEAIELDKHAISVFPIMGLYFKTMADRNRAAEALYTHRMTTLSYAKMAEVKSSVPLMFLDVTQCLTSAGISVPTSMLRRTSEAYFHTDLEFTMRFDVAKLAKARAQAAYNASPNPRLLPMPCLAPCPITPAPVVLDPVNPEHVYTRVIASFDIEAVSATLEFPDPNNPADAIVCICTTVYDSSTDRYTCFAHALRGVHPDRVLGVPEADGGEDEIPPFELFQYDTELELLEGWRDLVCVRCDVDVFMGWYTSVFDWSYMFARFKMFDADTTVSGNPSRFPYLSRRIAARSELSRCETETTAHGTAISEIPRLEGRDDIDLMLFIAKRFKFKSNGLDAVATELDVGHGKVKLGYTEMMQAWLGGDPKQRRRVVSYCVMDTILPVLIWRKLMLTAQTVQLSRVSRVFNQDIFSRGELWKAYSLLTNFAHEHGYFLNERPGLYRAPTFKVQEEERKSRTRKRKEVIDDGLPFRNEIKAIKKRLAQRPRPLDYTKTMERNDRARLQETIQQLADLETAWIEMHKMQIDAAAKGEKYQGATVLEPIPGFYSMVSTLDFSSLYPSIISALNLCMSSLVIDPRFLDLVGWDYEKRTLPSGEEVAYQQNVKGILPLLGEHVNRARGVAKKNKARCLDLAKAARNAGADPAVIAEHEAQAAVYDGEQLALKLVANSLYGSCGANESNGKYTCREIAQTITTSGRELIEFTKTMVERDYKHYGARVIYGDTDSVMVTFDEKEMPSDTQEGFELCFKISTEIAAAVSACLPPPHDLQMEKVYKPYFLFGKKRYMGIRFLKVDAIGTLTSTGIMTVRRDYCEWQKDVYGGMSDKIMNDKDPEGAVELLITGLENLLDGQVDVDKLVKTTKLKKEYKNRQKVQCVVEKMEAREKGSGYRVGDRVPFIMIFPPDATPHTPDYELAEDAEYIKKAGVQPDAWHYINHLKNAVVSLMEAFRIVERIEIIFDHALVMAQRQRQRQTSIVACFGQQQQAHKIRDPAPGTSVINPMDSQDLQDGKQSLDTATTEEDVTPTLVPASKKSKRTKLANVQADRKKKKEVSQAFEANKSARAAKWTSLFGFKKQEVDVSGKDEAESEDTEEVDAIPACVPTSKNEKEKKMQFFKTLGKRKKLQASKREQERENAANRFFRTK